MELVRTKQDVRDNLEAFDRKLKGERDTSGFYHNRVKKGHNFVSYKVGNEWRFAPSRYIGYKDNSKEKHGNRNNRINGGPTDDRLSMLLGDKQSDKKKRKLLYEFAGRIGIMPDNKAHKFFPISFDFDIDQIDPMEIPGNAPKFEGKEKRIRVNVFERDPKLREQCVRHQGYKCKVCDFDFLAVYGEIGREFIHVHHIVPLASIRDEHSVDPVEDLIPVCPNCHAMLHRRREEDSPRTIKELKKILTANARKRRQDS